MTLLSTHKRKNTGMSNHEYATRFGWIFEFALSPEEYLDACESFECESEIEQIARKRVIRVLRFRRSFLGRVLVRVAKALNSGESRKAGI